MLYSYGSLGKFAWVQNPQGWKQDWLALIGVETDEDKFFKEVIIIFFIDDMTVKQSVSFDEGTNAWRSYRFTIVWSKFDFIEMTSQD